MSEADKIIKNLKNSGKKVEEFYVSNKTSDENVDSIEDDVRILFNLKCYLESLLASGQDKICYNDLLYDEKTIDCINAIEDLLKERKKYTIRLTDEEYGRVIDIAQKDIAEQKDKRIQELEEENRIFALEGSKVRLELYIKENYIPIQVVKDKIKEIKRLRDKCITTEGYNIANGEVVVLQELLEGEK